MFDLGMFELLVIGVVALIVVGPKDLPGMFRTIGRFTGKARAMAREFQRAMDQAADESGVKDIDKTIRAAANPKSLGIEAAKDAAKSWTSTASFADKEHGPKTAEMTPERAETAKKISEAAAKKANDRKLAEESEASEDDSELQASDDTIDAQPKEKSE